MLPLFEVPTRRRATFELIFAASLWGFGFIASRWAFEGMGAFWVTALRFFLACAVAAPLMLQLKSLRPAVTRAQFKLSAIPGLLLGATLCLQTYGLQFTTVTRCSFITVLYVVFVPLLEIPWSGRRLSFGHFLWVVLALIGVGLMCGLFETNAIGGSLNRGDWFTLACAFAAALHILQLETVADQIDSSFVFNVFQTAWAFIPAFFLAVCCETLPKWPIPPISLAGLAMLSFASTLIAFMIQVRTQRVLAPSVVSMLFLLESPFGAFFAYLMLSEKMDRLQWVGGLLIFIAAAGTIRWHDSAPHE